MILIDGTAETETVAIEDAVQELTPEITVYVVVTVGVTITMLVAGGFEPLLAVQTKGPAPEAVKVAL